MAKKIVRGITDVKTITNQDYDTNNVNDLLSDGQYNYIHRKKGENEEYHNLTDNIKTISSDNTDLLAVTNNNKTTNTATLSPKHDKQKEQVLESTRDTVTIHHGTNGTAEKTTVDTNPQKVLEHENLISDSEYITLDHKTDVNKTHIKTESLKQELQQLHDTKQDTLTAGEGITIQGNTIDTNPLKVLEHENLISDSIYITLEHQTGENTTHIQTAALKERLDGLQGRMLELYETISSIGAGTSSIEYRSSYGRYQLFKYVVTNGAVTFVTYTFNVNSGNPQLTFDGDLKNELEKFVGANKTVSSGALTITNDGTSIIVTNSKSTEDGNQQGTFTFFDGLIVV